MASATAVGVAALVAGVAVAVLPSGATAEVPGDVLVCGLMPDTKTSTRWEQKDRPALEKAFKAAGVPARIVNAQGSAQTQKTQADQCIADGAKVLIIAPLDSGSASAIEKAALKQGVKSIDYDRQVEGGVAALYTSFNGRPVGVLQGKSVILGPQEKRQVRSEAGRRLALGWLGGRERVPLQERRRRNAQPALQERHLRQGPAAVRARLEQPDGRARSSSRCSSRRATRSTLSRPRTTGSRTPSSWR